MPKSANRINTSRKASFGDSAAFSLTNSNQNELVASKLNFDALDMNEFIIRNTRELEQFKKFLDSHGSLNDLLCWMDIEAYMRIDPNETYRIEQHAKMLKKRYFNKKYFFAKDGSVDSETQNLVN